MLWRLQAAELIDTAETIRRDAAAAATITNTTVWLMRWDQMRIRLEAGRKFGRWVIGGATANILKVPRLRLKMRLRNTISHSRFEVLLVTSFLDVFHDNYHNTKSGTILRSDASPYLRTCLLTCYRWKKTETEKLAMYYILNCCSAHLCGHPE